MTAKTVLFEYLKREGIIQNIEKEQRKIAESQIELGHASDLHIRDSLIGTGTILKEDLNNHYYICSIKSGFLNNVLAYVIIHRNDTQATIVGYAREGLINQRAASKAVDRIQEQLK